MITKLESKYLPIPEDTKQKLLGILTPKVTQDNIGLFYLDVTEMEELFLPVIEDEFGVKTRFERVWGHYMTKGGSRPNHKHNNMTFLYYLSIPEGDCGSLVIEGIELKPIEGMMSLFPADLSHTISENKTNKIRWTLAAECFDHETIMNNA